MKKIFFLIILISVSIVAKEKNHNLIVWPAPPQKPRIQYLDTWTKAEDLNIKKSFFSQLVEMILGEDEKSLVKPFGITITKEERIIVTDTAQKNIFIFDRKNDKVSIIQEFNKQRLESPIDVASDNKGNIYVSDSKQGYVYVFDQHGSYKYKIGGDAKLHRPTGIVINNEMERIYISDTVTGSIKVFTLSGQYIKTIGQEGSANGEFKKPTFLALDKEGRLYVSDSMNQRIQILDAEGNFIRTFGQLGKTAGNFANPRGIALDPDGNIYVSDTLFNNIQVFNQNGEFLLVFGTFGNNKGEFSIPEDIAINEQGMIYIVDSYNMRIQLFQYLSDSME